MTVWLAIITLAIGVLLVLTGKFTRRAQGLADGRTLDLDSRTMYSARLGLSGRPDRIVEENGLAIPEEWKSSNRVFDSHRAQMAVYFLLIEEETGIRPTHGFIVTGDGRSHRIENTEELREWVLGVADQIRAARRDLEREIRVKQPAAKCRTCGVREGCGRRND